MPILTATGAAQIRWRSPLREDDFAEYRDASFLRAVGLDRLESALAEFWPSRGPQWDALGLTDQGDVLIVEAKAHIGEMCSPASQASYASRVRIEDRLRQTASSLDARQGHAPWIEQFYQLGNRLAHLHFLRQNSVPAWLVLVNFIGDIEMHGPETIAEWKGAYQVAWHVMGLRKRHALARYVIEVFPHVDLLT